MSDFNEFDQNGIIPEKNSGSIISTSFELFKGVFLYGLLAMIIYMVASWLIEKISGFDSYDIVQSMRSGGRFDFQDYYTSYINADGFGTYAILSFLLGIFLGPLFVGLIYIANKQNNHEAIQINDLFIGYRQNLVNILLYTLISNIVLQIAFSACLIPGFFVAPFFLLGYPVLLFENASVGDALSKSFTIAKDNYGTFLGASFLGILISSAGIIACCIGIIATAPFVTIVAYCTYVAFMGKPRALINHNN